ncbi:MAG: TIR domain-containing protein, partial [Acetobacteraceae bacterium]
MTDPTKAVFLSYASQDAEAARRICESVRAAGIEVWFDQSELRGGDVWDRQIRKQIHGCALFIPIISEHSQSRLEGYFRREWKLAADRTHDMAEEKASIVPVVIDDTSERHAIIPDKFRDVQWTQLPAGETPRAFVERVSRLLTQDPELPAIAPPTIELEGSAIEAAAPPSPIAWSAQRIAGRPWPGPPWRWGAVTAAAVLAVVLGVAAWLIASGDRSTTSLTSSAGGSRPAAVVDKSAGASPAAMPHPIAEASIAVLPFDNQTGDKDKDYWGDGIAEELINALSKVPGLQVRSKTSSFAYKGRAEDAREIASELRVAKILEGTVQKGGDLVRVNVQLVDGATGQVTVSQNFEEKFANVFKLYDDVSNEVVKVMDVDGGAGRPESVRLAPPTRDAEAYRLTLQGLAMLNDHGNAEGALNFFQRAVARDPNYARAYAGIATAHLFAWAARISQSDIFAAEQADQHALRLDPNSAEAESGLGQIAFLRRDMVGAEEHDRKAEMLDPNDAVLRFNHATV